MKKKRKDTLVKAKNFPLFGQDKRRASLVKPDKKSIVFGPDDRVLVEEIQNIPFCYIVQIVAKSKLAPNYRRLGTGFLIGESRIATAAHNLLVKDVDADSWTVYFFSNGDRGASSVLSYQTTMAKGHPKYKAGAVNSSYDVAMLTIDTESQPLPSDLTKLEVLPVNPGELIDSPAMISGYPSEVPDKYRPKRSDDASQYYAIAKIIDHRNRKAFYSLDTTKGQSGAPLIVRTERGSAAVGIHVTGSATSTTNAAVAIDSDIASFLFQ